MKLGTLLAAGKSLMKGREEISYRANRQVYLPKFGSVKNPFKPEAALPPLVENENSAPAMPPVAPRPARVVRETPAAATTSPIINTAQKLPPVPVIAEKKKTPWADKLNPALIFRRATVSGGEKPLVKMQKPAATQTELSLDSVKVVHNDLSDVDVEVVPMKSRTGAAELSAPKKSWEFLGERLLGIEAS